MATKSWVEHSEDNHFPIQNIPFGVISTKDNAEPRCATRIGDFALDLSKIATRFPTDGDFTAPDAQIFSKETLNGFMALGRPAWKSCRATLQSLLGAENAALKGDAEFSAALIPVSECTMHCPSQIGDYTDFYSSR